MKQMQNTKPVFIRIFLKKVAVLIIVLTILTILLNYIAASFFEIFYTSSLKSEMEAFSNGLELPDIWNPDTREKFDMKLGIKCAEELTDGIRYMRIIDGNTQEVIADSMRRAYLYVRSDTPGNPVSVYICDPGQLDISLSKYTDTSKSFFTYHSEHGRIVSDQHYFPDTDESVDLYYIYRLKDAYIKGNTFLPGVIDVFREDSRTYDAITQSYASEFVESIDLTPSSTEGYEHIIGDDHLIFLPGVGTPETSAQMFLDQLSATYMNTDALYVNRIDDGSLFGAVNCVTRNMYTHEDGKFYIIECYGRASYKNSIGFIVNIIMALVYIISFILLLLRSFHIYRMRLIAFEQEEYRRTLMNAMAHDLKSPLMAIRGYAENLKENVNSDKKDYYADSILTNSDYMNSLISDNLELLKLEYDTGKSAKEKLELVSLASQLLEKYKPALDDRKIRVNISESYTIKGNRAQISTAIENLISNAVKYVNDNGEINVSGDKKAFVISNTTTYKYDNVDANELWKPFVKGDESRSNETGSGLGLAIAHSILSSHKLRPDITITTPEDAPTIFTVTIRGK